MTYEFRPSPRGQRPPAVDLHLDGARVRRLLRLRRLRDIEPVIALLEDAHRLGAGHQPCDLRAEVVVPMLNRRPAMHPCYSASVTGPPRVILLEDGEPRTLVDAPDVPPGTTPELLAEALGTAFTIGQRTGARAAPERAR
ncbi:hypothetical protein [Actinomadura nitritigenes]|uniref:hypothetical protein n=1 Tax=Actinomadura nitritigenes TaxID=134602 RepID=UPI003D906859